MSAFLQDSKYNPVAGGALSPGRVPAFAGQEPPSEHVEKQKPHSGAETFSSPQEGGHDIWAAGGNVVTNEETPISLSHLPSSLRLLEWFHAILFFPRRPQVPNVGFTNISRKITSTQRFPLSSNFPLGSSGFCIYTPLTHSHDWSTLTLLINPFIASLSHLTNIYQPPTVCSGDSAVSKRHSSSLSRDTQLSIPNSVFIYYLISR